MKLLLSLAALLLVSACGSANVQPTLFLTTAADGSIIYHLEGYTNSGELEPDSGRKYMEQAMTGICPQGFRITRFNEAPAHNAVSKFLYWNAEGQCSKPSR